MNQKIERQLLKQYPDEKIYIDKISGSIPFDQRPSARELLRDIDRNKIQYISVSSIDRLGRNTLDVLQTIEKLHCNEICLKVDNLGLESLVDGKENPTFKLIISVLANISEMERNSLLERQREGIQIAKAKGIYKGRLKNTSESVDEFLAKYPNVISYLNRKNPSTIIEIAKLTDCSKNTVQKVKRYINKMLSCISKKSLTANLI